MKFELSQNIERWCQEALSEIDGTPASQCEKVRTAALVYQVKLLADISHKLSKMSEGKSETRAAGRT